MRYDGWDYLCQIQMNRSECDCELRMRKQASCDMKTKKKKKKECKYHEGRQRAKCENADWGEWMIRKARFPPARSRLFLTRPFHSCHLSLSLHVMSLPHVCLARARFPLFPPNTPPPPFSCSLSLFSFSVLSSHPLTHSLFQSLAHQFDTYSLLSSLSFLYSLSLLSSLSYSLTLSLLFSA